MSSFTEILQAHVLDVHVPNILIGISASVEIPLITILARRIGATHSEVASFVLVSALCRSALDIPCGILVEYVGVRNMMLASLLLNVFASLIGFMTRDAMYLTMYCVVSGISLGAFFLSRHIFVAGISSKRYRGMLMSFLSGLLRWSHVIGPTFSGFIASSTGDIQDAFIMSAVASAAAFASISATIGARYQARCAQSCTVSCAPTPCTSETDVGSVDVVVDVDVGEEEVLHAPPTATTTTTTLPSTTMMVHPRLTAGEEHHFRLATLWHTCVDHFTIIWRLGLYVILFGALRSNRKLMLVVAGMAHNLSDAQLSYLLSFSFAFDAVLFPLGGILMDVLGRQYAMVPVALGLSAAFLILPMCSTTWELYTAASIFGVADALGCGLVMTITADRAPSQHGAPFFGIIRTLEDLGHVVGAGSASYLLRTTNIGVACEVLALQGIITACWGLWGVPRDVNPLESSRSHHHHHHHHDDDDAHEHAQLCTRHVSYGTTATTHPPVLV